MPSTFIKIARRARPGNFLKWNFLTSSQPPTPLPRKNYHQNFNNRLSQKMKPDLENCCWMQWIFSTFFVHRTDQVKSIQEKIHVAFIFWVLIVSFCGTIAFGCNNTSCSVFFFVLSLTTFVGFLVVSPIPSFHFRFISADPDLFHEIHIRIVQHLQEYQSQQD